MKHMLFFAGLFCAAFAFAWLFEAGIALAQSTGGDPFAKATSTVDTVIEGLRGGIARAILTLALVAAGILAFTGRIKWPLFASFAIGAIIIVTASEIANLVLN